MKQAAPLLIVPAVVALNLLIDRLIQSNTLALKLIVALYVFKRLSEYRLSRPVSRATGWVMDKPIPKPLRKYLLGGFCRFYKVRKEDLLKPVTSYRSFREFFTRKVKARKIGGGMISPCDAKILSISQVSKDECMLIKGVNYRLGHFLTGVRNHQFDFSMKKPETKVYSCVLYLAPGDYHRYHCPVDFVAMSRLHIPGHLAPVKESNLKAGLYEGNERVVLEGRWAQGFMYITFVGATNVGSMSVNFDTELLTNREGKSGKPGYKSYAGEAAEAPYRAAEEGILVPKGEEIGFFNMGSTVVLVFEAADISWIKKAGLKVRYGECLAQVG